MAAELLLDATPTTLASFQLATTPHRAQQLMFFLHGFTQNSQCWGPFPGLINTELGASRDRGELGARDQPDGVLAIGLDCPGHGRSLQHGQASLDESAELIRNSIATCRAHLAAQLVDDPEVVVLGYSMGGRLGLHATLIDQSDSVEHQQIDALVAISATAGIADEVERQQRRVADQHRGDYLQNVGLATFLDEWLQLDLFKRIPPEHLYREERLNNDPVGLAQSLMHQGTAAMQLSPQLLERNRLPTLLISGTEDSKFVLAAAELHSRFGPTSTHVSLDGAGHSPHLEQPSVTAATVAQALVDMLDSGHGHKGLPTENVTT